MGFAKAAKVVLLAFSGLGVLCDIIYTLSKEKLADQAMEDAIDRKLDRKLDERFGKEDEDEEA